MPSLRMSGAIHLLPHTPSYPTQGHLHPYIYNSRNVILSSVQATFIHFFSLTFLSVVRTPGDTRGVQWRHVRMVMTWPRCRRKRTWRNITSRSFVDGNEEDHRKPSGKFRQSLFEKWIRKLPSASQVCYVLVDSSFVNVSL